MWVEHKACGAVSIHLEEEDSKLLSTILEAAQQANTVGGPILFEDEMDLAKRLNDGLCLEFNGVSTDPKETINAHRE